MYEKGAEVIRLYRTLLGEAGFRKGFDLYITRHDGQAVTCDDFLQSMAEANGADLEGIRPWYSQAGTPELTVVATHDPERGTVTLKCALALFRFPPFWRRRHPAAAVGWIPPRLPPPFLSDL